MYIYVGLYFEKFQTPLLYNKQYTIQNTEYKINYFYINLRWNGDVAVNYSHIYKMSIYNKELAIINTWKMNRKTNIGLDWHDNLNSL